MTDLEQVAINGLRAGHNKMQILTDMMRTDVTVDLAKAAQIYAAAGKDAGLILTNDEKTIAVKAAIAAHTNDGVLNREAAVAELTAKGIAKTTAVLRLRETCAAQPIPIKFPQAVRVRRDMAMVHAAYRAWVSAGASRESIEAGLIEHFAYGEKNVKQAYTQIGRELGLIDPAPSNDRTEIAKWFAVPANVEGTKKDIVARHEKAFGCKTSTAEVRYTSYQFAVAYSAAMQ